MEAYGATIPLASAELVDLSGEGRRCRVPANYPQHVNAAVGLVNEGKPMVCGGGDQTEK